MICAPLIGSCSVFSREIEQGPLLAATAVALATATAREYRLATASRSRSRKPPQPPPQLRLPVAAAVARVLSKGGMRLPATGATATGWRRRLDGQSRAVQVVRTGVLRPPCRPARSSWMASSSAAPGAAAPAAAPASADAPVVPSSWSEQHQHVEIDPLWYEAAPSGSGVSAVHELVRRISPNAPDVFRKKPDGSSFTHVCIGKCASGFCNQRMTASVDRVRSKPNHTIYTLSNAGAHVKKMHPDSRYGREGLMSKSKILPRRVSGRPRTSRACFTRQSSRWRKISQPWRASWRHGALQGGAGWTSIFRTSTPQTDTAAWVAGSVGPRARKPRGGRRHPCWAGR